MDLHQQDGQLHRCTGQRIDADELMQKQQDGTVGKPHCDVRPHRQLAGIINSLLVVPRTDAAAHHRDHGQTNGLPRDAAHAVQIVCHGVGGDLHGAEGGDHAHHQNASGLEQAVLKGGRDADAQNALCHLCIQPGGLGHRDGIALLVALAQDKGRCHHTRQHAGPCNTVYAHFKSEDAHCVAHNVDHVHHQAGQHADLAVALRPEQRRTGVVQADERVAQGREQEVGLGIAHHVHVDGAEDAPQDGVAAHYDHGGHHQAEAGQHKQDLCGGGLGVFGLPVADVLAGDHRAAGGQRRHDLYHQGVEGVHKAHARHRRLAHRRHHEGIGQADGHAQGLLGDERQQQCHQRQNPMIK